MRKQHLLILLMCMLFTKIMADMPGNKPRPGSLVHLNNLDTLKPFTLMIQNYQDGFMAVKGDTIYNILGGYGARQPAIFFAINGASSTDTVYLDADEDGREINIHFIEVSNNRLIYSKDVIENGNEKNGGSAEGIGSTESGDNFLDTYKWLIGLSIMGLAGLVVFFVIRKRSNANIKKVDNGDV